MLKEGLKTKVASNIGAAHPTRYFHHFHCYRTSQVTTSNIAALKEAKIGSQGTDMVFSDLQPHALNRFNGDKAESVVVAIPKHSNHYKNLLEMPSVSLMCGHTDPQIFHWFKSLNCLPPRSMMQGKVKLLDGEESEAIWGDTFHRHPVMHLLAEKLWKDNTTKTKEEKEAVEQRVAEEDAKRMRRMVDHDWLGKSKDREKNPSPAEDKEQPVYVMKPEAFQLIRVQPDTMLHASYMGKMKRVWPEQLEETETLPGRGGNSALSWKPTDRDPLARAQPRFVKMLNASREKLISSLNMVYNLKLMNVFVYDLDSRGLWAMGCQENFDRKEGEAKEQWCELFIEYGKEQVITHEADFEWWVRGLTSEGRNDSPSNDADLQENLSNYEMRHATDLARGTESAPRQQPPSDEKK